MNKVWLWLIVIVIVNMIMVMMILYESLPIHNNAQYEGSREASECIASTVI